MPTYPGSMKNPTPPLYNFPTKHYRQILHLTTPTNYTIVGSRVQSRKLDLIIFIRMPDDCCVFKGSRGLRISLAPSLDSLGPRWIECASASYSDLAVLTGHFVMGRQAERMQLPFNDFCHGCNRYVEEEETVALFLC